MKKTLLTTILATITLAGLAVAAEPAAEKTEKRNPLFDGWYADPQIRLYGDDPDD